MLFFILGSLSLFAQSENNVQSPYFHITTEGIKASQFPLLSSAAEVNITGPIADVKVIQKYKNNGEVPIEAVYVFPASTRAAVYEMKMYVGQRVIEAEIQEKNKARSNYEKAKKEGKRASLLEQHRPNVFQMNVANLMPGEEIRVEMKYNEFLIPTDKIYQFVYPTVVGPRFADKKHFDKNSQWVAQPYTKQGASPSYTFDVDVLLNAGMEIQKAECVSHHVDMSFSSKEELKLKLKPHHKNKGERDFVFEYSLAGDEINQGTFLYSHGDENFFLTMIQPPAKFNNAEIPNREYVFVVDVSGSMRGFPLDISKDLMQKLVSSLKPTDKFNILLFAGGSKLWSPQSKEANQKNLTEAFSFLNNINGGGSTQLLPALRRALDLPSEEDAYSRSIVVITDGYVHVEREAMKLIAENLHKSNLFAFGIGSSVNRHLIEGMAHAGAGEPFVITDKNQSEEKVQKFKKYIEHPLLTDIDVRFSDFDAYDVIPFSFPDLMAERPLYIFGKYRGSAVGDILIYGKQGDKDYCEIISTKLTDRSAKNSPIRYLWAREKIRFLDDLNAMSTSEKDVEEITALGLKYDLLTKYTSFVAIDQEVVNGEAKRKKLRKVNQPLPLPHGVSNHAVGFELKEEMEFDVDAKLDDEDIFVQVTLMSDVGLASQITNTLSSKISYQLYEKRMLDGNTLNVSFDAKNGTWSITDDKRRIDEKLKMELQNLLARICGVENSVAFKIQMLWI